MQSPIQQDIIKDLGVGALKITTGAVCVYPNMVAHAVKFLEGTGIPVASVAAGFPAGMTSMKQRLQEIEEAVADGAREIDIVITRQHVLQGNWTALYDEVSVWTAAASLLICMGCCQGDATCAGAARPQNAAWTLLPSHGRAPWLLKARDPDPTHPPLPPNCPRGSSDQGHACGVR